MTSFEQSDAQLSEMAMAVIVPRGSGVTAEDLAAVQAAIRSVDAHLIIRVALPPTGGRSGPVAEDQVLTFSVLEAAALQTALEVVVTGVTLAAVNNMKRAIGRLLQKDPGNTESKIAVEMKYRGPGGRSVVFTVRKTAKPVKVNAKLRQVNPKRAGKKSKKASNRSRA